MSSLSVLSSLDIRYFHDVFYRLCSGLSRSGAFNVIYHHLVPNKLIRLWFDVLKRLQLVFRIQWVLGRVASVGLELIHTWLAAFNVSVGQVELWFVQFEVQHPRTSSLHIESVVKVRSDHCLSSPYFWLGPYTN